MDMGGQPSSAKTLPSLHEWRLIIELLSMARPKALTSFPHGQFHSLPMKRKTPFDFTTQTQLS